AADGARGRRRAVAETALPRQPRARRLSRPRGGGRRRGRADPARAGGGRRPSRRPRHPGRGGYPGLGAGDVAEAEQILLAEEVDVVLLDVHVGPESGVELMRRLRERGGAPPVVLVTGS